MRKLNLILFILVWYQYEALAQPAISSFTPVSGKVGTSVTINGSGFSTTPSLNIVYFGKIKATVSAATATSLTVTVPAGATYQPITVNVSNLIARSSKPFLVTFGASEALSSSAYSGHTTFATASNPMYMAEGDLDNDGKIDLVTSNLNGNSISIFRNTATKGTIGSSSYASKSDISCSDEADAIHIDDIDGDGKLDLIVGIKNSNVISVFRNTSSVGSISFASASNFSTGTEPYFIAVNDFDGDGKLDIVTSNRSSNNISIFQNSSTSGTVSLSTAFTLSAAGLPHGIIAEDLDGDGKPDIAVNSYNNVNIVIYRNIHSSGSLSSSSFSSASTVSTGTGNNPVGLAAKDIDGDNKVELICMLQASGKLGIFLNTGSSGSISFASVSTFTCGTTARSAYVNDMNGDGKPDIVCANIGSNNMAVFQNNSTSGSLSLSSAYTFSTNSQPHMALAIDVDGDTKPEIVSCNYNANTISVYRNSLINTEPTTAPTSLSLTNMTGTTVDLGWTNGNGSKRIVLVRQTSAVNSTPVDETDYTAGATFGSGTQLGTGNYVVYSGSGSSVTITGLITGQTYHFAVFEYNGADATSNFLTSSFGTANALLPVTFVDFTATPKESQVELNWITASETNNRFFTVERSTDGYEFTPIATVMSKAPNGNSNVTLTYQTFDTPSEGTLYYRIKQTDFDGVFAYSKTIAVVNKPAAISAFIISPSPTNGFFTVYEKQKSNESLEIAIYNLTGQCVYQNKIAGTFAGSYSVDASKHLAAGTYICHLQNSVTSESYRKWYSKFTAPLFSATCLILRK